MNAFFKAYNSLSILAYLSYLSVVVSTLIISIVIYSFIYLLNLNSLSFEKMKYFLESKCLEYGVLLKVIPDLFD